MMFPSIIFNVKRIKRKMKDCQYVDNFLNYHNNYKNDKYKLTEKCHYFELERELYHHV